MDIREYTNTIKQFIVVPDYDLEAYLVSLLASEAGEVAGLWGKALRKDFNNPHESEQYLQKMKLELGDTLWAWALLVEFYGFTPEEIMKANVEKLRSRQAANAIRSNNGTRTEEQWLEAGGD